MMIYLNKMTEKKSTFWWIKRLLTMAGLFYFGTYYVITKFFLHSFKYSKMLSNLSLLLLVIFEIASLIYLLKDQKRAGD